MSAATLYTPEVLAAAVSLAAFPLDPALPLAGDARSRSCGSVVELRIAIDHQGRVAALGCGVRACAVGQAAAAIFVGGAKGRSREQLAASRAELARWLGGAGDLPDWPGIALIGPARPYPARHGAILLAWDAALAALEEVALAPPAASS